MQYHDKLNKIREAMKAMEELVENEIIKGIENTPQDPDNLLRLKWQ